jgi:hypothetical protein
MSASATLPSSLSHKLTAVIRRLRFLRFTRGLSRLAIGLTVFLAAALLVDFLLDLPGEVRGILLIGWLGLGAWLAIRELMLPMRRQPAAEVVAAAIEEEFPQLAERLTTTIELAPLSDEFHGSPDLKALLMAETESLSGRFDFREAFPTQRTTRWCLGAVFALLLIFSPALFWPDRLADLARRFFLPWQDAFRIPYALNVTPGDAFAAKGRALSLSAQLMTRREGVTLPQSCYLVRTDANGTAVRDRMISGSDGFSFKVPRLSGDIEYHLEAGKAISDTFQITAVDPVEIETNAGFMWQADSPVISITPPVYARASIPTEKVHEIADLSALQHSQVEFFLRFNRPAVAARVNVKIQEETDKRVPGANPQAMGEDANEKNLPINLSPDRREGRVEVPAAGDATYQVILEAEHGILTELEPRKLSVKLDQPPKFMQVVGVDEAKEINPYDQIPLEMTLTDDVGVESVEVEYRINKGPSQFEPITLEGKGTQKANAKYRFSMAGKVKDGDEFTYRLKAEDNRRMPEYGLEPNIAYYPAETEPGKPKWRTLKVAQQAKPIGQQDILARRDDINRKLEAIKEDLLKEQRGLYKLRMESRYQSNLMPDQVEDLRQFRRDGREIEKAIRDLARTAAEFPNFMPLARRAQDVADRQMQNADQKLKEAEQASEFRGRDQELHNAERELAAAVRRLDAMHQEAERLAQLHLDQMNLENLANRQEQLAQETTDQIMRDPVKQPATPNELQKLQQNQNELVNELQKQIGESPDLRHALESIRAEQTKGLSDRARELARGQRDLNRAAEESHKQQNRDKLAELARKQKDLADRAERLGKESRPAAEAAHTSPLKTESARQAAKSLEQGDAAQAMRGQDQAAQELDRLGRDLDKAREQGKQREAARQLADRQEKLRQRVAEITQKNDPKQTDHLKELEREQKAIQQEAEKLPLPPENGPGLVDKGQAVERAGKAAQALQKADTAKADSRMTQSRQALERMVAGPDATKMKLEPQAQESRRLAEEQRQLRNEVDRQIHKSEPLTAQAMDRQKNLLNRQEELRKKAGDLAGELLPLGQQMPQIPQLMQAFSSEHNARGSMKQAQSQTQAGQQEQAQKSRQEAAQFLDQAAQQIQQAAQQMARSRIPDATAQQQTGQALQQAQGQMKQAQGQLNQGQNRPAQNTMHQAAQALQQAAQGLAQQLAQEQQNQPGTPVPDSTSNGRGVAEGGQPNIELFGKDKEKYAGKPWGQLPGELRNQIIQDMKARYGEDYARIIKLYFEQIAETKQK